MVRDVEYKKREDPSEPILSTDHAKGYSYGPQCIPFTEDIEKQIEYVPVKGMRLLGFANKHQVPRHHFMKDTFVIVPESDESSSRALSSLVQQCELQEKVAIVQCALRKGSSVFLGVMTPFMDRDHQPDVFLMNAAPFADDIREFTFGSFSSKDTLKPSEKQMEIMAQIVQDGARMQHDEEEKLQTDLTSNPILHRFHRFLGKRAFEDPEEDPLTQMVFHTDKDPIKKELQASLDASVHLFKKQKTKDSEEDD